MARCGGRRLGSESIEREDGTVRNRGAKGLIATIIGVSLAACGGDSGGGGQDVIKVALVVPFTGGLAALGREWRQAAQLAVNEVNAAGGPLEGKNLEVVVIDDENDPDATASEVERLIDEEGVVGVIGGGASSISLGLAPVTAARRIPQVSCCSTSDKLTEFNRMREQEDRFFFRVSPPDGFQAQVLARAAKAAACTKVVILALDNDYARPLAMGLQEALRARSVTAPDPITLTEDQSSYASEVQQAMDLNPTCVAAILYPDSAGKVLRDWNAAWMGEPVQWFGPDGLRNTALIEKTADPALVDGFVASEPLLGGNRPESRSFEGRWRSEFGLDFVAAGFAMAQYDATALLALAIAAAGSTDGDAVRDALWKVSAPPADGAAGQVQALQLARGLSEARRGTDLNYEGASGPVDFDSLGNVLADYALWRYERSCPMRDEDCPGRDRIPDTDGGGCWCQLQVVRASELTGG